MKRRTFLQHAALAGAAVMLPSRRVAGQAAVPSTRAIDTPALSIAYEDHGDPRGFPVILLHGFPDDVRAFDDVVPPLIRAGLRALVPYLRGYGPTRFRDPSGLRMAEQAAIGQDVIDSGDALKLPRFGPPAAEHRAWYQWYFNTERGRAALQSNRRDICRYLWQQWSPGWRFTEQSFNRTAASFDNPDFVDVVIHSYRHRIGNAPGEPRFAETETRLASRPRIDAPSITLYGAEDGIARPSTESPPSERAAFAQLIARRVVPGVGHFMPRERPAEVSSALLELLAATG